jgi:hypothetical protein
MPVILAVPPILNARNMEVGVPQSTQPSPFINKAPQTDWAPLSAVPSTAECRSLVYLPQSHSLSMWIIQLEHFWLEAFSRQRTSTILLLYRSATDVQISLWGITCAQVMALTLWNTALLTWSCVQMFVFFQYKGDDPLRTKLLVCGLAGRFVFF